jgi:hypothetical protein
MYVDVCMDVQTVSSAIWSVYPNPTSGTVTISTAATQSGDVIVELYSTDGKLIRNENHQQANIISISITDEPVGTYILRITANGQVSVQRLVKL